MMRTRLHIPADETSGASVSWLPLLLESSNLTLACGPVDARVHPRQVPFEPAPFWVCNHGSDNFLMTAEVHLAYIFQEKVGRAGQLFHNITGFLGMALYVFSYIREEKDVEDDDI
ncbi:hypothetical protein MPTK1_4g17370 [Marchantia polymorpha subsp. ruderalis]|uniref:Uncharacterized protein n=2 Tax=Marchantia polymorpha TaxID=3197 RepID=A0AAF6BAU5_MARPO|nr:hypothetical protein MARPO_0041s0019 [Marchantia polymorpha]BBN09129.1 hypothetical protein Mp_4g17370 [Marchantia polymorpha subsp. ruderalis]|eukprot:PTQ40117.1 hypothetical protein MARPO_0041s0019 [Marchantia polymorpha]